MNLNDKVALVTGGAVRVGKSIAHAFAKTGANIVINYNASENAAHETVREIQALGVRALAVQADVGDVAQCKSLIERVKNEFGGLDILVNSASRFQTTPWATTTAEQWRSVLSVLVDGPFFLSQAAAPMMQTRGAGVIINILDLSIYEPWPNFLAHSVGKAGLQALTRGLALELAPTIRVNGVVPGAVLAPEHYQEDKINDVAQRTLLRRWGSPQDVADAVIFLAQADFITGETITVDGGERWGRRQRRQS